MFSLGAYPTFPLSSVASRADGVPPADAVAYDYIVVGGGTAGCVLANRLSEAHGATVLLVERGKAIMTWKSRVPLLSMDWRPDGSPTYKWKTAPLAALANSAETTLSMVGGKLLGGSSKVNACLYTRSVPGEYNAWAEAGREGWGWDDVLPYFVKSETSLTHGGQAWRGTQGPWQNRRLPEVYFKSIERIIEACPALGIPYTEEANNPNAPVVGIERADVTIDASSYRCSTLDAFLPRTIVQSRASRLKICTEAIIRSVHFDQSAGVPVAAGVWLERDVVGGSAGYYARARREVILCNGAICSPQTLLLSGVGPADHLEERGIPVVKDLPGVGSHLQDHLGVPVIWRCALYDSMHGLEQNPWVAVKQLLRYVIWGQGLFLSPNPQCLIFARSDLLDDNGCPIAADAGALDAHDSRNLPDIEIMPIPYQAANIVLDLKGDGAFSLLVVLLRPRSSGTVRLESGDVRARPACDLGTLQDPRDLAVMRKGIKLALRLGEQMRKAGYVLKDLRVPQSSADADMDKFILAGVSTTYHYSSSCCMAPEAEGGVVDDMLRVHGVRNLRVADASIFPTIPACHLQAPTVMVAERCADFLRASGTVST